MLTRALPAQPVLDTLLKDVLLMGIGGRRSPMLLLPAATVTSTRSWRLYWPPLPSLVKLPPPAASERGLQPPRPLQRGNWLP